MKHLGWFLVGCALVLAFQVGYVARYHGDWTVLVRVGAIKPHRDHVEQELGPLTCVDPLGHDGQANYLIARDPLDRHGTSALIRQSDNPPYRYRRILYPLLAGGFGWFGPWGVVAGLVFWTAVGGGLMAAACADLCSRWQLPGVALLFALFNPGIYLSAQVLTNDVLAMGLALAGVAWWGRRSERLAGVALAAAVLARETSILVSLVLAWIDVRERRPRAAAILLLVSGLPYFGWSLWVRAMVPGGDGLENLSPPLVGLLAAPARWTDPARVTFGLVTVAFLAASAVIAWKADNRLVRLSCLAWIGLSLVLSDAVWEHPGNALRAICPLWMFAAFGYGFWKKQLAQSPNHPETKNVAEPALALPAR